MAERIFSGDTAVITSALLEEDEVNLIPITAAEITVVDPTGRDLIVTDFPASPTVGDRVGLSAPLSPFPAWSIIEWGGVNWNQVDSMPLPQIEDNTLSFGLSGSLTELPGLYQTRVKFTTVDGFKKSDRI